MLLTAAAVLGPCSWPLRGLPKAGSMRQLVLRKAIHIYRSLILSEDLRLPLGTCPRHSRHTCTVTNSTAVMHQALNRRNTQK